jgi:hypothetical protein
MSPSIRERACPARPWPARTAAGYEQDGRGNSRAGLRAIRQHAPRHAADLHHRVLRIAVHRQIIRGQTLYPRSSFAGPVFVLCNARSGSTLLRFVLDADPGSCMPAGDESSRTRCADSWRRYGSRSGARCLGSGEEPPAIRNAPAAEINETMNRMTGSYLLRRGKRLLCDTSLSAARYVELLTLFPERTVPGG